MGRIVFFLYDLAGWMLTPLLPLFMKMRARSGKEDAKRLEERYGLNALDVRGSGPVWIHAASVGETNAVLPLARYLIGEGHVVLLTTGTKTSAGLVAGMTVTGLVHRYFAHDLPLFRNRFLDGWNPAVAIFTESEVWPGYFRALEKRGIPSFIVNARMSEKSFTGWSRVKPLARIIFGTIGHVLARSEADAAFYAGLGARNVTVAGDLKFGTEPPRAVPEQLLILRGSVGKRPVFVAASLHPGEDGIILEAAEKLKEKYADLLLVMIPRHPERGAEMAALAGERGHQTALRSRKERIETNTGVYVADTLGELGLFFRLAPSAFIGGSLVPKGGQNPLEPVKLGVLPVTGPHMENFADACRLILDPADARETVESAGSLADILAGHFEAPETAKVRADRGNDALKQQENALFLVLEKIMPFVAKKSREPEQ